MNKETTIVFLALLTALFNAYGETLRVGSQEAYRDIMAAAAVARAGDTIFLVDGIHRSEQLVQGLDGTPTDTIVVTCNQPSSARVLGGRYGLQLSQCSFVRVENIMFESQSMAGFIVDHSGPAGRTSNNVDVRHVRVERGGADIGSVGIRFVAVDYYEITGCVVNDGAWFQGIDLVGSNRGVVRECTVSGLTRGAGIVVRAGSQFVDVARCTFEDCAAVGVNLGGVSNASDFRPLDVGIECADARMYSCVVKNCATGMTFDGTERCIAVNNTFVGTTNNVFRLGTSNVFIPGLRASTNNQFVNNIVVFPRRMEAHVAVMAGTDVTSHIMSNNLWFNRDVPSLSDPNLLGIVETTSTYGEDPLFVDPAHNFGIRAESPAVGKGVFVAGVFQDRSGRAFIEPRSIGAYQFDPSVSVSEEHLLSRGVSVTRDINGHTVRTERNVAIDWFDLLGRWLGTTSHSAGVHVGIMEAGVVWRVLLAK